MENTVPRECFLFSEIVIFERIGNIIYKKDLTKKEKWRLIIYMNGTFLDLITGDEILPMPEKNGTVVGPIYENIMYLEKIQNPNREITKFEYSRGQEVYQTYLLKKELMKEKKLIPFKQKRLY